LGTHHLTGLQFDHGAWALEERFGVVDIDEETIIQRSCRKVPFAVDSRPGSQS